MSNLKQELHTLFDRVRVLEMDSQRILSQVNQKISTTSVADLVDAGYMCREISKVCDTLRKAFELRQSIVGRTLATVSAAAAFRGEALKLEGTMATGSVNTDVKPKLPDSNTPEHAALLRWLGVPEDLIAEDKLRPSFKWLQRELSRRLADGKPLPDGIKETFSEMMVEFRTKTRRSS